MNNVFKVFFYPRKNYVNKNGEVAIRVLLSLNGDRTQFTSKLTIPLEIWDDDENRVSGNSPNAKVINNELEDIEATLKFHYKELIRYDTSISVLQVRDAFLGVTIKTHMLLDVFKNHNEELSKRLGKDLSSCAIAKYKRTEERLAAFIIYLKEIADLCGIEKNLTFHLARHTFATTVTLAKGVPMETVSKMLGHTNLKTTQIYARITDQKISHDMQGLSRKLQGMYKALAL